MSVKSRNRAGVTDPAAPHRPHVDTNRFRIKRFSVFVKMLEGIESKGINRVLDVGGTRAYWEGLKDYSLVTVSAGFMKPNNLAKAGRKLRSVEFLLA